MADRFYVTTPIYYSNDAPHLGHAYTTIAADTLARWHRLKGVPTRFLTGVDEHGQKVMRAAEKLGRTPQEHVDALAEPYQALWRRLDISHDDFIRTTEPRHQAVVKAILQRLYDDGEIYADTYEGWYSTSEERFWMEKDLIDGRCPLSGNPVEWISEKNYFFRMSKYADQLRKWVADHPDFVQPESRKNELLGYLDKEVGDLCISRPKERMSWGIPLTFDDDYVTYVWFDALINYISAIGHGVDQATFERWWPASYHLVGKDILTTHAVYWSTMLFALGLSPARCLYAHGWWTVEGRKMSKTTGNVVKPDLLLDAYGPDAVRYFVLREIAFGADGDFAHENLLLRYNSDLANDLGNLAHRGLSMTEKWLGGVVPTATWTDDEEALQALATETAATYARQIEAAQFKDAIETLLVLVRAGNKYIDTQQPWALNKANDLARLGTVMRAVLEVCRLAATLISPICPCKATELLERLTTQATLEGAERLDRLTEGAALTVGDPLFPRLRELPEPIAAALASLDQAALDKEAEAARAKKKAKKERARKKQKDEAAGGMATFEDFQKLRFVTGTVLAAEKHPDADRLLVVRVDVGEADPRTIVAGIAKRYAPDDLVGLQVVVVANLKPAKLRGVTSQGMLLAAGSEGVLGMATITEAVANGTVVR